MPDRDWVSQHNIELKQGITEIIFDGVPMQLTPIEVRIMAILLKKGKISYGEVYPKNPEGNTGKVYISNLRAKLADQGFPYTIGKACRGPVVNREYTLTRGDSWWETAENGGDNERFHSTSPGVDRLQDPSGGTARRSGCQQRQVHGSRKPRMGDRTFDDGLS